MGQLRDLADESVMDLNAGAYGADTINVFQELQQELGNHLEPKQEPIELQESKNEFPKRSIRR